MSDSLAYLLEKARTVTMTPSQQEAQRRSFAYANTKIENDLITRDMVAAAADALAVADEKSGR